jgi:hypothetical protein
MNDSTYWVGVDIGQANDPTCIAVCEARTPPTLARPPWRRNAPEPPPDPPVYIVKYLERIRLNTSYPAVVQRIAEVLHDPQLDGRAHLVLDGTGVGRALVDMTREAGLNPLAISIHGGDNVTSDGFYTRVPKRDLAGIVRKLLDTERLKIIESLPEAPTLRRELQNFKVTINPQTAHDGYSAWREGQHDDLVLAVALAVWDAERQQHNVIRPLEPEIADVLRNFRGV